MTIDGMRFDLDKFMDRIPGISALNSIIDLFQKYCVIPFLGKEAIQNSRYWSRVDQKSCFKCVALFVPVIGNLYVYVKDRSERKNLERQVDQFLVKGSSEWGKDQIVDILQRMPVGERAKFIEEADKLPNYCRGRLLLVFAEIPQEQRDAFLIQAKEFIVGDFDITNLEITPQKHRLELLRLANDLCGPNCQDPWLRSSIMQALTEIPQEERENLVSHVKKLTIPLKHKLLPLFAGISQEQRTAFVEQLNHFLEPEISDFVEQFNQLQVPYKHELALFLAEKIPQEHRSEFVIQANRLFTQDMSPLTRETIIGTLCGETKEHRLEFLVHANGLLAPNLDERRKRAIVQALTRVPAEERAEFVTEVNRFSPPDSFLTIAIIEIFAERTLAERANLILYADLLLTPDIRPAAKEIIGALVNIAGIEEREQRVTRAAHQLELDDHEDLRHWTRVNYILRLLETPLNQPLPRFRPGQPLVHVNLVQQPNAQAVDVHAGNRDELTKQAIIALRANQGPITEEEIDQAVVAFQHYLDNAAAVAITDELRARANKALTAPREGGEGFGPLFADDIFSILGLVITGQEWIARLWRFCETYREPLAQGNLQAEEAERENARLGMIVALSNCFNEDRRRVCNPGKVQRLGVSVLQGRLPGVNIDGVPVNITQIVNLFFANPAMQQIDNRVALITAATQYLDQNPAVNRVEFLGKINEYADVTF